ncbi:MAG: glycosyltransferase family 39 protein [Desulfomonile tiedjei]|uniref:Glycosyltransferase family 39 protein n=1 Tax=Desulfomonile tiedjei TaxID=2358 RepID=A0A9D6V0S1_9BACT|nr:glycosyltransferase family 39 protein [Desulfomonile tiedjei]
MQRMTVVPEKEHSIPSVKEGIPFLPLLAVIGGVFLWRVLFATGFNLIPDECSYWTWSRRLDWSYFDNSGMVAYLIRLSTEILGQSTPYSVRLPFVILSGFTTYLVYTVSRLLFRNRARALFCATLFNLVPPSLLGGAAAIHDNALIFFWLLALCAAAQYLKTNDLKCFYFMGIAAGGAILSKYTGVLVLPCLLFFLLWNRQHRPLLLRKEPWIGALIAVVFALPILWWSYSHDWASLYHIFFIGSGAKAVSRRILDGLGYHVAQFGLVSPFFYLALIVASVAALTRNLREPKPEETLLLCFGMPAIIFGAMAFKGHVEANWGFIAYPSLAILAVETILTARKNDAGGVWKLFSRRHLKWGLILAVGPVLVVVAHAYIGLIPAFLEKRYAKEDRIIWETRGWKDLGNHVAKYQAEGEIISADSYQLCALLEFNIPRQPKVRYLAPWKRPTQFDVWEPSFDNMKGRDILFVTPIPLKPSSDSLTTIYENFAAVEELPSFHVMYHRESIRNIHLYRCKNFDPFSPRRLGPRSLFYQE